MPVNAGRVSSREAATATCAIAVASSDPPMVPLVAGIVGSGGYSATGIVGMVKVERPQVINAREPSTENSIGADGSERVISASSLPGTKTVPGCSTSAFRLARALTSASLPDKTNPDFSATRCMPVKSGRVDLLGRVREAHETASAIVSRSTLNFTGNSHPLVCYLLFKPLSCHVCVAVIAKNSVIPKLYIKFSNCFLGIYNYWIFPQVYQHSW